MPKKKRTSRKSKISCKRKYGMETCRTKRCNLKNIEVQIGDPYKVLILHRQSLNLNLHFYVEITNPRKNCVYAFGLNKANAIGFNGDGSVLMIHDAQISKVSKQNKLKSGEILTQKDINRMMGEEEGEIDHLQKKIIDIFNERSIIYKFKGKNHSRIAYLDVPFDLLGICFADIPGNYTYQINEPSTFNCRKGAVLFHYQPHMLLQMVDKHLVNHNIKDPDFKSFAQKTNSLPLYEYSPELVSSQISQPSLSSSSNQQYYSSPIHPSLESSYGLNRLYNSSFSIHPLLSSSSNQQYYSAHSDPLSLGSSSGLNKLYIDQPALSPVVRERRNRIKISPDPFSPVTSPVK